jgi:ankyrin repeat protein
VAGADPNTVDDEGETVLHRAVAKKHIECAIVILENGGCRSMGILNAKELTYVFFVLSGLSINCWMLYSLVACSDPRIFLCPLLHHSVLNKTLPPSSLAISYHQDTADNFSLLPFS